MALEEVWSFQDQNNRIHEGVCAQLQLQCPPVSELAVRYLYLQVFKATAKRDDSQNNYKRDIPTYSTCSLTANKEICHFSKWWFFKYYQLDGLVTKR